MLMIYKKALYLVLNQMLGGGMKMELTLSLTHTKTGKWYWRNWLGLMQSPYFETEAEAKEWKEKFHK